MLHLGGYIGFGCIAIAAYGMAIGEVLKREPQMGAYLPSFLTSRNWRFVPAIFFTLGIIIWIGSEYIPAWSHSDQHEDCSNSIIERLNMSAGATITGPVSIRGDNGQIIVSVPVREHIESHESVVNSRVVA